MTPPRDPFDFDDDDPEKTVIQPVNPGGRLDSSPQRAPAADDDGEERTVVFGGAAAAKPVAPTIPRDVRSEAGARGPRTQDMSAQETEGVNQLVAAAARLLALAGTLRETPQVANVVELRERVVAELSSFEKTALQRGIDEREVQLGHYVLCALIDDVVMATPWGRQFGWSERSITSALHNQVDAGDRMYELAARLQKSPSQHPDVLELVFIAFSLGFEGSMRLDPNGAARHAKMRDGLFRAVRERRDSYERRLSGAWRGAETGYRPLARRIPPWVWWAGCGVVAMVIFSIYFFALDGKRRIALAGLDGVAIEQAPPPESAFVQAPIDTALFERVRQILAPDIERGFVVVEDAPGAVNVRIVSQADAELFRSAQAVVSPAFRDTVSRIGEAALEAGGAVRVRGYSDSQPIATQQYRSNYELSAARAEAVRAMLSAAVSAELLSADGRGSENPIAGNDTSEGRRLNRRVEVTLQKPAGG